MLKLFSFGTSILISVRFFWSIFFDSYVIVLIQKQPSRGVLRKRYSENMQQIYGRTTMPKCDFNKVAKKLEICCIFAEHLFLRTPVDGCF